MATEHLIPLLCYAAAVWAVGAVLMGWWMIRHNEPMPTSTIITFEELRKR